MSNDEMLDKILNYLYNYCKAGEAVPLYPNYITDKCGMYINKQDSYRLLSILCSDSYVNKNGDSLRYIISTEGIKSIENKDTYVNRRKIKSLKSIYEKVSLYIDIIKKPLGLILIIYSVFKIINFFL